jgi:NADH:ubiquinone oxidoreductase subunit H
MQPLAIAAVTTGAVMLIGVTVTLILVRRGSRRARGAASGRAGLNSWHRHGSIPLVAAGLTFGAISRIGSGQTSATHDIIFAVTTVLLLGALLCALAGAAAATRRRPDSNQA